MKDVDVGDKIEKRSNICAKKTLNNKTMKDTQC